MTLVATTAERVTAHTPSSINARIEQRTEAEIASAAMGGEASIRARLAELDREWDVERCLETGASSLVLAGLLLSVSADRKWLWLSGGVAAFLLQHAVQGWCPPLSVFRRLGVRTADEIARERYALKALLGSYGDWLSERGVVGPAIGVD